MKVFVQFWLFALLTSCTVVEPTEDSPDMPDTTASDLGATDPDAAGPDDGQGQPDGGSNDVADTAPVETTPEDIVDTTLAVDVLPEDLSPEDLQTPEDLVADVGEDLADGDAVVGPTDVVADPRCAEALAFVAPQTIVEFRQNVFFEVSGGSGERRFELAADTTGSSVHRIFGTFRAGTTAGDVTLRVVDALCEVSIELALEVVAPLVIMPEFASIEPIGGRVSFQVSGGSGNWTLSVAPATAFMPPVTATVDDLEPGLLEAGGVEERVRVTAVDLSTGASREALVDIVEGGGFSAGARHLVLPVGETFRLSTFGGSGVFTIESVPDPGAEASRVSHVDDLLEAVHPGRVLLEIEDLYTTEVESVVVDVVESLSADLAPSGVMSPLGEILYEDLDGDGVAELILGLPDVSVGAVESGAVFIYRGLADGFELQPMATLTTPGRRYAFGASIAIGDVDGDGEKDLLVGAPDADGGGSRRGEVHLFLGQGAGHFPAVPSQTLRGELDTDFLGRAVALCDVDDDGRDDVLVTATGAEDEASLEGYLNVGNLSVYLGTPTGLGRRPTQVIWGYRPGQQDATGFNLGAALATGDIDGDGRCDVAVSSLAGNGAVFVFRARVAGSPDPSPIELSPTLTALGDADGSGFGASLGIGDLDGDGTLELVVGDARHTRVVSGATRRDHGRVVVFHLPPPGTGAITVGPGDAAFTYLGRDGVDETNARIGTSVWVGDFDGVPPLDLFVGVPVAKDSNCNFSCGAVHVLAGVPGAMPDPSGPDFVYSGDASSQSFGTFFAPTRDLDGDGLAEIVARAERDTRHGPGLGATLLAPSDRSGGPLQNALTYNYVSAGSSFGGALTSLPDLDGDGEREVVVGAPLAQPHPEAGSAPWRSGATYIYLSTDREASAAPSARLLSAITSRTQPLQNLGIALAAGAGATPGTARLAVGSRAVSSLCDSNNTNLGTVQVLDLQMGASGLDHTLAGVFHMVGPVQRSQSLTAIAFADVDGDGEEDLVVGGGGWDREGAGGADNRGGVAFFFAREAGRRTLIDGTPVACAPDLQLLGFANREMVGASLAPLGDLNADGCADLALGAPGAEANGIRDGGRVLVLFGFGPSCQFMEPHLIAISPRFQNLRFGESVATARLGGSPVAALAVGAPRWGAGDGDFGAVWLFSASWLASLADLAQPWSGGSPESLLPSHRGGEPVILRGERDDEQFGVAIALVAVGDGASLLVGRPLSQLSGVEGAGAVSGYEIAVVPAAGGERLDVSERPWLVFGGETSRSRSGFGSVLSAWPSGNGLGAVVAAPESSAFGLDDGAVIVSPLLIP